MSGTLAQFQDAFVDALFGTAPRDERVARVFDQAGFAVYRNTVFKGCIDALQANFPAVARLVGEEWFRAAAAAYVPASPPADARLVLYGADFPAFLAAFEPARELPYLADVARLDRLWVESHVAHEDALVDAAAISALSAGELERAVLRPHAAARWIWFDAVPAYTIWRANREECAISADLVWQAEGALLTRPRGEVTWRALSAAGNVFLEASAAGQPFETAAQRALDAQPHADLGAIVGEMLAAGAFAQAAPASGLA
jgi:Putative DNA-binding domain